MKYAAFVLFGLSVAGLDSAASAQRLNNRLGPSVSQSLGQSATTANTRIATPQVSTVFNPAARDALRAQQEDCFGRTNECRRRAERAMSIDAQRAAEEACFGRTNDCRRAAEQMAESSGGG